MIDGSDPETKIDCRTVHFALSLFSVSAIKQAAYKLSDRVRVDIDPSEAGIDCRLYPLKPVGPEALSILESDFRIEVLDYDLREKIALETEPLRNLILSVAFSNIAK
jgi:His-Xaa-Ser system protein HxsD